jgi:hypothetical protein
VDYCYTQLGDGTYQVHDAEGQPHGAPYATEGEAASGVRHLAEQDYLTHYHGGETPGGNQQPDERLA